MNRTHRQHSVSVVLPTHNELANLKLLIPQIFRTLKSYKTEIIVVDDASRDGSVAWLKRQHYHNPFIKPVFGNKLRGIGHALRRGYNLSSSDIIVSLDADLSLSAAIIPRLLARLDQGCDLVVGSRHHQLGQYQAPNLAIKQKRLISQMANFVIKSLLPVGVSDFSLDCRAIKRSLWLKLKLKEKTNIWLIEMIVAAAIHGANINEIPVTFKDRRFGTSKLRLGREIFLTGYRVLWLILRFHLSRLKKITRQPD